MTDCPFDDLAAVAGWMRAPAEALILRRVNEPITDFLPQIESMIESYPAFPKDEQRMKRIRSLLQKGQPALPIYAEEGETFVMEGRHRLVAFFKEGLAEIPVIRVSVDPAYQPDSPVP